MSNMRLVDPVSTCNRAPDILGRCTAARLPRPETPTHGSCTPRWSVLRFPLDLQTTAEDIHINKSARAAGQTSGGVFPRGVLAAVAVSHRPAFARRY